jgi:hypothetical protein
VVVAAKFGSTQYLVPETRLLQVVTEGLARRNWDTVMPATSDREAQVSPTRAVTTRVQGSAADALGMRRAESVASASEMRMVGRERCLEAASSCFWSRLEKQESWERRADGREVGGTNGRGARVCVLGWGNRGIERRLGGFGRCGIELASYMPSGPG